MKFFLQLAILLLFVNACSSRGDNKIKNIPLEKSNEPKQSTKKTEGDQYTLVFSLVDNRSVVYINDSIIFDTGIIVGGTYEKEIILTEFVEAGKTELKVELYNVNPPSETKRPGWMIVYDILINDELIEFVRDKKNEGKVGLVYSETYDLSDIW
ncbi:hypothetical protein [Ekhidna sp.]